MPSEQEASHGSPQSQELPRVCFVIARPRSGTTVFSKMLLTHPKVTGVGEIFNESNPRSYFQFLQQLVSEDPSALFPSNATRNFTRYVDECRRRALEERQNCKVTVLDVKYDQCHLLCEPWWRIGQLPKLLYLLREKRWKVIDVHRREVFKLSVSNQVAIQTKIYHSSALDSGQAQTAKIHINPSQLARDVKTTRKVYAAIGGHFQGRAQYRRIYYEEMFDGEDGSRFSESLLESISSFLGLKNLFDRSPKLEKLLRNDIYSYIENAPEIRTFAAREGLEAPS